MAKPWTRASVLAFLTTPSTSSSHLPRHSRSAAQVSLWVIIKCPSLPHEWHRCATGCQIQANWTRLSPCTVICFRKKRNQLKRPYKHTQRTRSASNVLPWPKNGCKTKTSSRICSSRERFKRNFRTNKNSLKTPCCVRTRSYCRSIRIWTKSIHLSQTGWGKVKPKKSSSSSTIPSCLTRLPQIASRIKTSGMNKVPKTGSWWPKCSSARRSSSRTRQTNEQRCAKSSNSSSEPPEKLKRQSKSAAMTPINCFRRSSRKRWRWNLQLTTQARQVWATSFNVMWNHSSTILKRRMGSWGATERRPTRTIQATSQSSGDSQSDQPSLSPPIRSSM